MTVTYSEFWVILLLPPLILIALVAASRHVTRFAHSYGFLVAFLTLTLGVWMGFWGVGTYGALWIFGFFFNPLLVGLLCTRRPIAWGMLASLAVAMSGIVFFFWYSPYSGESPESQIQFWSAKNGKAVLAAFPFFGMALSLIPTVPIALYRRYISTPQQS